MLSRGGFRGGGKGGGGGLGIQNLFPMNNDIMHTAICAAKKHSVSL